MGDEESSTACQFTGIAKTTDLVSLSYAELCSVFDCTDDFCLLTNNNGGKIMESLLDKIHQAYASTDSLGILILRDLPLEYVTLRQKVLPFAQQLATTLSPADLEAITIPKSDYQVGWSYGNEKLDKDRMDYAKGSFYFNPLTDNILKDISSRDKCNVEMIVGWNSPAYTTPNVWPSSSNSCLNGFESSLKELGKMVYRIGLAIAQLCDQYLSRQVLLSFCLNTCISLETKRALFFNTFTL